MVKVPKVSVLIPCYNSEKYISETIRSVLNQTWKNLEIIVIDDGSEDKSINIVKDFEKQFSNLVLKEQTNAGACVARNEAFSLSTGDYIQFLDSDDILHPLKIERQILGLQKSGLKLSCGVFSTFKDKIPREDTGYNDDELSIEYVNSKEWLLNDSNSQTSCWLASRQLIEIAGGWNEKLLKNQDGEFFDRVVAIVDRFISQKYVFTYYRRQNENSITKGSLTKIKVKSSYLACESYENVILGIANNSKGYMAIANRYLKFCYNYGSFYKAGFTKACDKIKQYGPTDYKPFHSKILNVIGSVIGNINLIKIREGTKKILK